MSHSSFLRSHRAGSGVSVGGANHRKDATPTVRTRRLPTALSQLELFWRQGGPRVVSAMISRARYRAPNGDRSTGLFLIFICLLGWQPLLAQGHQHAPADAEDAPMTFPSELL